MLQSIILASVLRRACAQPPLSIVNFLSFVGGSFDACSERFLDQSSKQPVSLYKMENPEEILHSLEEFSKLKPKDIPRELEEYLCFVAKTGDPVYQWGTIKSLFREKLINVITDFYESCPSVEIPPCPNVEVFNYESMKSFILEKLDTFAAAPFTVQRICELLTTPRKEYNRIDKYMRALEKNILVVSTTEPGNRRSTENGEGIVNGIESEHLLEPNNPSNDINVEEMDDTPVWSRITPESVTYQNAESSANADLHSGQPSSTAHTATFSESRTTETNCGSTTSTIDSVIACRPVEEPYVSIEPVASDSCLREESVPESDVTVTITAIPAAVQKRRDSIEPVVSSGDETLDQPAECTTVKESSPSSVSLSSSSTNTDITIHAKEPNETEIAESEGTSVATNPSATITQSENNNEQPRDTTSESPIIQIPIISEVTSGVSEQDECSKDLPTESLPCLQTNKPVTEQADSTDLEETSKEPASADELEQPELNECSREAELNESSVMSPDEASNDAADVDLKINQFDPVDEESRSCDQDSSESLTVHCASSTDPDLDGEDTQDKSLDDTDSSNHRFASASMHQESMDIDINEDSCQEAPTSHG